MWPTPENINITAFVRLSQVYAANAEEATAILDGRLKGDSQAWLACFSDPELIRYLYTNIFALDVNFLGMISHILAINGLTHLPINSFLNDPSAKIVLNAATMRSSASVATMPSTMVIEPQLSSAAPAPASRKRTAPRADAQATKATQAERDGGKMARTKSSKSTAQEASQAQDMIDTEVSISPELEAKFNAHKSLKFDECKTYLGQLLSLGIAYDDAVSSILVKRTSNTMLRTLIQTYQKLNKVFTSKDILKVAKTGGTNGLNYLLEIISNQERYQQIIAAGFAPEIMVKIVGHIGGANNLKAMIDIVLDDPGKFRRVQSAGLKLDVMVQIVSHVGGSNNLKFMIDIVLDNPEKFREVQGLGLTLKMIVEIVSHEGGSKNLKSMIDIVLDNPEKFRKVQDAGLTLKMMVKIVGHIGGANNLKALIEIVLDNPEKFLQVQSEGLTFEMMVEIVSHNGGSNNLSRCLEYVANKSSYEHVHIFVGNFDRIIKIFSRQGGASSFNALVAHANQLEEWGFSAKQIFQIASHASVRRLVACYESLASKGYTTTRMRRLARSTTKYLEVAHLKYHAKENLTCYHRREFELIVSFKNEPDRDKQINSAVFFAKCLNVEIDRFIKFDKTDEDDIPKHVKAIGPFVVMENFNILHETIFEKYLPIWCQRGGDTRLYEKLPEDQQRLLEQLSAPRGLMRDSSDMAAMSRSSEADQPTQEEFDAMLEEFINTYNELAAIEAPRLH